MLDCERFRDDRAKTAGTGKSREGHPQVDEEQQFHSERNSNRLSTLSKSALRHPLLPESAIRHTHVDPVRVNSRRERLYFNQSWSLIEHATDPPFERVLRAIRLAS